MNTIINSSKIHLIAMEIFCQLTNLWQISSIRTIGCSLNDYIADQQMLDFSGLSESKDLWTCLAVL